MQSLAGNRGPSSDTKNSDFGSEVLTAVTVKNIIFWHVTGVSEEQTTSIFRAEE
jgi:hypothetical protein